MASVTRFVIDSLRLTVHPLSRGRTHRRGGNSAVDRPMNRKFPCFTVSRNGAQLKVADQALDQLKECVRELTRRTRGSPFAFVVAELREPLSVWKAYFVIADVPSPLGDLYKGYDTSYAVNSGNHGVERATGSCANTVSRSAKPETPASPRTLRGGCRRHRPCRSRSRCASSNKGAYRALRCGRNWLHRTAGYVTRSSGGRPRGFLLSRLEPCADSLT